MRERERVRTNVKREQEKIDTEMIRREATAAPAAAVKRAWLNHTEGETIENVIYLIK